MERQNERTTSDETATTSDDNDPAAHPSTDGLVIAPLATAAVLGSSIFSKVRATEAIPATWEERARKAWEYYIEKPLVKNCVNSWRTFAVGDEIKITSDDEDVKSYAASLDDRLSISAFVKDMILQLLVKGDSFGFKRYTKDGKDLEEVICVNPVLVEVKYSQGQIVEARQYPDDNPGIGEGLELPVDQVRHLKWDAPFFFPTGQLAWSYPPCKSIGLFK